MRSAGRRVPGSPGTSRLIVGLVHVVDIGRPVQVGELGEQLARVEAPRADELAMATHFVLSAPQYLLPDSKSADTGFTFLRRPRFGSRIPGIDGFEPSSPPPFI